MDRSALAAVATLMLVVAGCAVDEGPGTAEATGDKACPFTTLYWDFLMRHEPRLAKNPRMALQVKNIARLTPEKRALILQQALSHQTLVSQPTAP